MKNNCKKILSEMGLGLILLLLGFWMKTIDNTYAIGFGYIFMYVGIGGLLRFCLYNKWLKYAYCIYMLPVMLVILPYENLKKIITAVFCLGFLIILSTGICIFICHITGGIKSELITYIVYTFSFIIATTTFYSKLANIILSKVLRMKDNISYNVDLVKYFIFIYYFVYISIYYIHYYSGTESSLPIEALSSFATFIAYDRLVANKKLLSSINISSFKDLFRLPQ